MKKKPAKTSQRQTVGITREIRARYDSAQLNDENRRHWAAADALGPNAQNTSMVRRTLRNRTRYEVWNNSYAAGIVLTIANDTVGTGPRLQMLIDDQDDLNADLEADFCEWAKEIRLAEKLRMMRIARCDSGEVFAVLVYNPALTSKIKLDVQLTEAEQIADPTMTSAFDPYFDDGIQFDTLGNPVSFRRLKWHPGESAFASVSSLDYEDIAARYVFHYYRPIRPGQRRGVPDLTPAIQLFAELRRYCAAVIAAAETAADFAAIAHTKSPPDEGAAAIESATQFPTFELAKRLGMVLPEGWEITQMKAEQPTTTYDAFVNKKLAEIARCINVPFTIAALDSSQSNLSARYLDSQIYVKDRGIDRSDLNVFLDRVLDEFLNEAIRLPEYRDRVVDRYPHQWFWPAITQHADPDKVASAQQTRLKMGLTTIPRELAEEGIDWQDDQPNAARSLNLTVDEYQKRLADSIFETQAVASGDGGADLARMKAEADAYGVAVRAGAITPQAEDEDHFRQALGLPKMSPGAKQAWMEDKGTRRPITIVQPGAAAPAGPQPVDTTDTKTEE